jgi:hypothetical protein
MLLNYLPEVVDNIGPDSENVRTTDIVMDMRIVDVLRKI